MNKDKITFSDVVYIWNTTPFENIVGHIKNILVHKWWVFYYACRMGIPWRGFMHDWSKFSWTEFWESVYFYQGSSSPIPECKKYKGFSLAWQHHKGRNPHHYEYWVDNLDKNGTPIRIPTVYVTEMICDYLAAGKTYQGKNFTFKDEYDWWMRRRDTVKMHQCTKELVTTFFEYAVKTGTLLGYDDLDFFYRNELRPRECNGKF